MKKTVFVQLCAMNKLLGCRVPESDLRYVPLSSDWTLVPSLSTEQIIIMFVPLTGFTCGCAC